MREALEGRTYPMQFGRPMGGASTAEEMEGWSFPLLLSKEGRGATGGAEFIEAAGGWRLGATMEREEKPFAEQGAREADADATALWERRETT